MTVGRNPKCNIPTLNPKTIDPSYSDSEKQVAGYVSGIHFYISHDSDGQVYIWDNKSSNGLYIQISEDEQILRIHEKTRISPGTTIFASGGYRFFLDRKIDIDAQQKEEERASTDTTQILKQDSLAEIF